MPESELGTITSTHAKAHYDPQVGVSRTGFGVLMENPPVGVRKRYVALGSAGGDVCSVRRRARPLRLRHQERWKRGRARWPEGGLVRPSRGRGLGARGHWRT